jgi:hypothetical protein
MLRRSIEHAIPEPEAAWKELQPVLHAEVDRLPERLRIPVILCYLEGRTHEEVAELLQLPVGTVECRLSRARDALRSSLMRRGMDQSAAFLVTALSRATVFAELVPVDLVNQTVRAVSELGLRSLPQHQSPHFAIKHFPFRF